MTDSPVHVGALSALELEGAAHYLVGSKSPRITLCSEKALPRWLNRIAVAAEFEWQGTRRFWAENIMSDSNFVREHSWQAPLPALYYSCPEKAILELLLQVPDAISFEHAWLKHLSSDDYVLGSGKRIFCKKWPVRVNLADNRA